MPTTVDSNGIAWFVASGAQGVISQSRNEATDDRWSGNVTGLRQGFEATFIGKSIGTAGGGEAHFAMKQFGGNHSGSGASSQRWYDTGVRDDGTVQLQWEGPHPNNHDFTLPASKQFITHIGVGLEGNWVGLKWCVRTLVNNGSPANGGIRCRMWVNTSIAADGKPNNSAWRLVYDFIDGKDGISVIDPQTYQAPDEQDCEVRRSDTNSHQVYAGGLHWRRLTAGDLAADVPGSNPGNPPPPPPPPQGNNIDQFGVKMIYPTKLIDGEPGNTWFQDNNPEFDGRLISDVEVITRIGDYFVASPEPEGDVYMKVINDFDPFTECDVGYSQLAGQGFVNGTDDWKNIEVTIFIYPQEIEQNTADPNEVQFALELRASDDTGNEVCCSDYRYAGVLLLPQSGDFAGKIRLNKRLKNNNRLENIPNGIKPHFFRSWTGIKTIVYNVKGPNNEDWVTVELWLCPSDSATDKTTNWTKAYSFIDKGNNWGTGGDACGGAVAQAITWGTAFVTMRYNLEPEIRWKHWSVREIDPNGSFPVDPPDPPPPPPDPCEEEETTTTTTTTTPTLYRFLSWGDNDTTSDATTVLDRMFLETNVSQYLFAGDGPYSTDANNWIDMMTSYFSTPALKEKLMLAQGNHEHPESESQNPENQIEQWFPGLHNANEGLEWLQQKKVGNAYIIVMNSQDPNIDDVGGAQYLYVQNALNTAKQLRAAGQIDWIITMVHKSWFNLLGSNPAYVTARHAYAAMFRDAQVDFMFHGHNHSYAIWRPIVAIPGNDENTAAQNVFTQTADGRYDFTKDHGAFYIINGNGGHELNSWGENPALFPNILYANDTVFGYTVLDIQGKEATITAKNAAGAVLYTVKATRGTNFLNNVIWDSNVDGKWNNGIVRTVTNTEGSQQINGKGIYMAASGNPRLHINGQGEGRLEVDGGGNHGRFYVKTTNYNSRLEGEFKINNTGIGSTTFKIRNRHQMSGDCEERFGGFGGHFNFNEAGTQIELCHNTHESSNDTALSPVLVINQWYGFKFTVQDQVGGSVLQKIELDRKDGNGFQQVHTATKTSPPAYYVDKAKFMENSEFWIRLNTGGSTASVSYRNVKLIDLDVSTTIPDPPPPPPPPDPDPCAPPPPPPPPESIYNDLILVYNINSDSDGCICNDPGFTPPPPGQEPCPSGQHRDPVSGLCVPDVIVPPPPPGGGGSGGENQAIYDVSFNSGNPDDIRMASESGEEHFYLKYGTEIVGTSSPVYNKNIKRIEWPLRKSGNPTGNATVVIRKGTDNSIAKTLGTIDVSDLTNQTEYKAVQNTTDVYNIVVGDRILLEYSGGDDNDYVIAWAVNEQQNNMRLTKQDNTMDDDEYRTREQEASFRAFA